MTITLRLVKGTPLTHAELDGNFTDLDGRVTPLEAAPPDHTHTVDEVTNASSIIASGTVTPRTDDIDFSGGSDGDVLTVQADGSLALETPAAAGGSGTVDTANSPQANEFARFTDADTIEGRTVAEVKTQLAIALADISDAGDLAALDTINNVGLFHADVKATSGDAAGGTEDTKLVTVAKAKIVAETFSASSFQAVEVSDDHSVTPYTVTSTLNTVHYFTHASNGIVEFPAGLSTSPKAYGRIQAPVANTLTLQRVAGSGVTINGAASDGFAWVIPANGQVRWAVEDTNTIYIEGHTAGEIVVPGEATFEDNVLLQGSISGGGLINVTRSDAGTAVTVADSGKKIITAGALTIPNTQIGDGWFECLLKLGADTHDIDYNGLTLDVSTAGFAAGDLISVTANSATTIDFAGAAGQFDQTDMA